MATYTYLEPDSSGQHITEPLLVRCIAPMVATSFGQIFTISAITAALVLEMFLLLVHRTGPVNLPLVVVIVVQPHQ